MMTELLSIAKFLLETGQYQEWSDSSAGSTISKNVPMYFRSCPTCGGVKPPRFNVETDTWGDDPRPFFNPSRIGHAKDCEMANHLRRLGDLIGTSRLDA